MVRISHSYWLSLIIISSCLVALSSSASLPVKAVNLGGWLVTEGWMTPWLFDNIPNKDIVDGTQVQLKSVTLNMYLSADKGGDGILVANRDSASGWETFKLWRVDERTFYLRVFMGQFIWISTKSSRLLAKATNSSTAGAFVIVRNSNAYDPRVRIRAPNGLFVQAKTADVVTADYTEENTYWGDNDPSVFQMKFVRQLQGEFQLTNGYGSNAASVLRKYNLGVIVDLHAAKGSQNGNDHSGTRDGSQKWGTTDENIDQTVAVIDFLVSRYAQRSGLLAIELINEPQAPGVTLDSLKKYYQAGYNAVRKYTPDAYVILSNRLGPADPTELLQFASNLDKSVIDVHYYNLYGDKFKSMTVQQNIDFVNNDRSKDLSTIMVANGPLIFVGEWTAEWKVNGATKQDYQSFAQAQLNVYGHATFGWAYWTWKNVKDHWNLEYMITNGYISL